MTQRLRLQRGLKFLHRALSSGFTHSLLLRSRCPPRPATLQGLNASLFPEAQWSEHQRAKKTSGASLALLAALCGRLTRAGFPPPRRCPKSAAKPATSHQGSERPESAAWLSLCISSKPRDLFFAPSLRVKAACALRTRKEQQAEGIFPALSLSASGAGSVPGLLIGECPLANSGSGLQQTAPASGSQPLTLFPRCPRGLERARGPFAGVPALDALRVSRVHILTPPFELLTLVLSSLLPLAADRSVAACLG